MYFVLFVVFFGGIPVSWNTETCRNLTHGLKQRAHAKKRMLQRYGVRLNRRDYVLIRESARNSRRIIERDTGRKVCLIQWQKKLMLVVYDLVTAEIATFLPLFSPLKEKP